MMNYYSVAKMVMGCFVCALLTFVSLCLLYRLTYESLTALEIPNDMLQTIQDLILDLRVRCVVVTLQHTAEGILRKIDDIY